MKGITPIVSIIILLLITIGLAAAAWTYMSNVFTGITAKAIDISSQFCIGGTQAVGIVRNIGTDNIHVDEIIILNSTTGNKITNVDWKTVDGNALPNNNIPPGEQAKVTLSCTSQGKPATCTYNFVLAGRTQKMSVYCSG
ncbi:MAG: archaellin/type IV pilin N-terminal domain-containing protein [Candidatus Aenigmatarchaeota archaeon]